MEKHNGHRRGSAFLAEVIEATPGGARIVHCLQCGSCGGSCPSGPDMDHTPRTIFAMINADRRDAVLRSNTMWFCVSCYSCTVRCPQQIPITEVMYALKRIAIAEGKVTDNDAPALAKTFTDLVERYGRAYEVGIAILYLGRKRPLSALKAGPMGVSMFLKGRMGIFPQKIRRIEQLQAIIKKARQIGGAA
jgi:heterodisulfide reductase subunit C